MTKDYTGWLLDEARANWQQIDPAADSPRIVETAPPTRPTRRSPAPGDVETATPVETVTPGAWRVLRCRTIEDDTQSIVEWLVAREQTVA